MSLDFSHAFSRYEALVKDIDAVFDKVREQHPKLVACELGCSDCCHALFDLSLVEAAYINARFNERFEGIDRSRILDRADEAERASYRLKKKAIKAREKGEDEEAILADLAKARIRCPLLDDNDACVMYEHRPITCRLYGAPVAIGDRARSCAKSGFTAGGSYPTVRMEKIYERLMDMSTAMTSGIRAKHRELGGSMVPLGMALMNAYDEAFFEVIPDEAVIKTADNPQGVTVKEYEESMATKQQNSNQPEQQESPSLQNMKDAAPAFAPSSLGMKPFKAEDAASGGCACGGAGAGCSGDCGPDGCGIEGCDPNSCGQGAG